MKPNEQFLGLPKTFWAYVRSISQSLGYTVRAGALKGSIRVPTVDEMAEALVKLDLDAGTIKSATGEPTELASRLVEYFSHRAAALNVEMPNQLMNAVEAKEAYEKILGLRKYKCPFPLISRKASCERPHILHAWST